MVPEQRYRCCRQYDVHSWLWVKEVEPFSNYLYTPDKNGAAILSGEEAIAFVEFCHRNGDFTAIKEKI